MTIAVAGIGLGHLGRVELETYAAMEDVEVVAGADVSAAQRDRFEETFDAPAYAEYPALLDEHGDALDAANIVTPHTLHYDQARACLDADLDVFLEKPLVTDIDDANDLVSRATARERVLVVGYQRHFHPVYRRIREAVEEGRIGRVHAVNAYLGQDWIRRFPDAWRTDPALSGGGQLYDSGSHLVDTVLWTTDARPVSVGALMDYQGHDVDVNSALALRLSRDGDPVTATIGVTADGIADPGTHEGLTIWGTEGRLSYANGRLTVAERGGSETELVVDDSTPDPGFRELVSRKLADFVGAVRGEHDPAVPGSFGREVVAVTETAYEAHETGRVVDVPRPPV